MHLRAMVTYYDPYIDGRHVALFVHDRTGSIFVAVPAKLPFPLNEGTLIDIVGVTGAGDFAPIVEKPTIRVTGQGTLAFPPIHVTLPQLSGGMHDGQWVELKGVVHAILRRGANVVIRVATEDGILGATTTTEPGANYEGLVGATIRVRGNEAPQFNERRQLTGVHIYFQSLRNVEVLRSDPLDPYLLPSQAVSRLLQFEPGSSVFRRTRIHGEVTLDWPGEILCVQDTSAGLCMRSAVGEPVPVGSIIDVVGFPANESSTPSLTDAVYRPSLSNGGPSGVKGRRITAQQALTGGFSGELVEIEGSVISVNESRADLPFTVSSQGTVIPVMLFGGLGKMRPLQPGSVVRLQGICQAQVDTNGTDLREGGTRFASFRLLLRTPEDVSVLKSPSWWNVTHTTGVLFAVALITLVVLGWVVVLRRRVEEQTLVIRQSEEKYRHLALHDPLTGLANRALLQDKLADELARAQPNNTRFALLMLDLDRFKQVNDTLGHHVGDLLLCAAAERIKASVTETDTVSRIGGDEFVVLLADSCVLTEPAEIAAKIVLAMAAPLLVKGHWVPLSTSIGVCTFPEGGDTVETLLCNVDLALYHAKSDGRNCVREYLPTLVEPRNAQFPKVPLRKESCSLIVQPAG